MVLGSDLFGEAATAGTSSESVAESLVIVDDEDEIMVLLILQIIWLLMMMSPPLPHIPLEDVAVTNNAAVDEVASPSSLASTESTPPPVPCCRG